VEFTRITVDPRQMGGVRDVRKVLLFAAEAVHERTLPLVSGQLGC
jgi:hypothetical protein